MELAQLHQWRFEYGAARRLQEELAERVRIEPIPEPVRMVAGADVSFSKKLARFFAAVVVCRLPEMEVVEVRTADTPPSAPYIPGMLTFREGPTLLEAFGKVEAAPDAVIFDGQGYAHPRRLGLACHMGLWLGLATVGCAKSRLVGEHEEPGRRKGEWTPLTENGERLGDVVSTRTDVRPVFVSPGHLADFATSRALVLRCCTKYRLPEPTRRAHLAVGRWKRRYLERRGP